MNDLDRVWNLLQRAEEQLRWGGGRLGHGQQYDSLGRPARSSSYLSGGWLGEQIGRVGRLRQALQDSGPLAQQLVVQTFSGIDMSVIGHILVSAAKDFAIYYLGSVASGGVIGGVGGAFIGGAGAIPGAATGMAAGGYVGAWILAILGLKSLVEGLVDSIPDALRFYARGFNEAWGPARQDPQHGLVPYSRGNISVAAFDFANGHVILVAAILTAMMAYLSRGKGSKPALLQEISQSRRLGPKVAKWLEENEEKLRRHPALQSRKRGGHGGEEPPPSRRPREPKEEEAPRQPKGMPKKTVPCFTTKGLPQGSVPEFDRQLAGQEAGINSMTVDEYLAGRKAFDDKLSVRNPSVAREARVDYEASLKKSLIEELQAQGLSPRTVERVAAERAADKMKTLAALHNPDMVAGGKDVIADFGDRKINSRIGAQWRKSDRLFELDRAAKAAKAYLSGTVRMNAKLERC